MKKEYPEKDSLDAMTPEEGARSSARPINRAPTGRHLGMRILVPVLFVGAIVGGYVFLQSLRDSWKRRIPPIILKPFRDSWKMRIPPVVLVDKSKVAIVSRPFGLDFDKIMRYSRNFSDYPFDGIPASYEIFGLAAALKEIRANLGESLEWPGRALILSRTDVPSSLIVDLMYEFGRIGCTTFELVPISLAEGLARVLWSAPVEVTRPQKPFPRIDSVVVADRQGYLISHRAKVVPCGDLPLMNGAYDYDGLVTILESIPSSPGQRERIAVYGRESMSYESLYHTARACRSAGYSTVLLLASLSELKHLLAFQAEQRATTNAGAGSSAPSEHGSNSEFDGFWIRKQPKRPADDVHIRVGQPLIKGPLSMEIVRRVFYQKRFEIQLCYIEELNKDHALKGEIIVELDVDRRGRVQMAGVIDSTLNNAPVEKCITDKIMTWHFPEPKGGGAVNVTNPVFFESRWSNPDAFPSETEPETETETKCPPPLSP